jgi:manganese efflux pump family protein
MSFFELLLVAIGLSMDCFAVAISFGTSQRLSWSDILKMALFFGLFQGVMPVIGWLIGSSLQQYIAPVDHWIAFGILTFIGLKMMIPVFSPGEKKKTIDIRNMTVLLSLSFATSIDALITGISFGFILVNILLAAGTITVVTFLNTVNGAKLGEKTSFIPAKWAEFSGGIVLIAIGTKILLEHLEII